MIVFYRGCRFVIDFLYNSISRNKMHELSRASRIRFYKEAAHRKSNICKGVWRAILHAAICIVLIVPGFSFGQTPSENFTDRQDSKKNISIQFCNHTPILVSVRP